MYVYHLVDEVAERYLDLVDDLDDEIDELEDLVADDAARGRRQAPARPARTTCSASAARSAPTRDAVHKIVDDRVELDDAELFPRDVEIAFGDAYDKLLRASEALESSRDALAGVRDYLQGKIANDQNEVMKRLTLIASLLLVPTFIVGLYGQNFHHIPELGWALGYWWSWGLIIATTVGQLALLPLEALALAPSLPCRRAVLHLPAVQGALGRHRRPRGLLRAGARVPPLRLRLPVRAARRLLPGARHGLRRHRPGAARARDRPRRLRADRLPRGRPDGPRRRRGARLDGFSDAKPVELAREWGVRRLGEQLSIRTRGRASREASSPTSSPPTTTTAALLVALTPANRGVDRPGRRTAATRQQARRAEARRTPRTAACARRRSGGRARSAGAGSAPSPRAARARTGRARSSPDPPAS